MSTSSAKTPNKQPALYFVIILGVVSLLADMTYEGARSITGPYLASFGASAAVVGFVAGFGELIGYALRLVSGFLADRSGKYWALTILGYTCNLLAVPLLALADHWWAVAFLIIIERMGKAIRSPSRDALLSHAAHRVGMGWGFGLHEALDKTGAMLGPLLVAGVLYYKQGYRDCFAILAIPALLALIVLVFAKYLYPSPQDLEIERENIQTKELDSSFWIYMVGSSLIAMGYADFPLIAYHFQKQAILSPIWIPVSYSIAMGVNALSAPILGRRYDRQGFSILLIVSLISPFFSPLVFLGSFELAIFGVILWSIGISAHESLMRAIVATMAPNTRRGSAFGVFNTSFGFCWFLGSFLMGVLYDWSIPYLVIFSVLVQLSAIPLLWIVKNKINARKTKQRI